MKSREDNALCEGISRRLRAAILQSGKSCRELEQEAGIGIHTANKYIGGTPHMPPAYILAKLCRALGVSADEILGLKED